MRGLFRTLLIGFALLEVYWLLPPRHSPEQAPRSYRIGAIHVRSPEPLKAKSVEALAAQAKKHGIDFLVIADPKSSHARAHGLEGTYDGVDVYVEVEAHLTAGHAVVFYSHTSARELSDEALSRAAWRHFLGSDPRPGMFLIVAHPDSQVEPWNRLDKFSEGVELVNLDTLWKNQLESAPLSLAVSLLVFPFSNYLAALRLLEVPSKNVQGWDAMNAISPGRVGVAGQELTAASIPAGLGSEWSFASALLPAALNAVRMESEWASAFETRKAQTYEALSRGRSALFFPLSYGRFGADWKLICSEREYRSGDTVSASASGCRFVTSLEPSLAQMKPNLRLVRDGTVLQNWQKAGVEKIEFPFSELNAGSYRLEIGIPTRTLTGLLLDREIPYVFYNPLYVR